jgi:hypothetical protein
VLVPLLVGKPVDPPLAAPAFVELGAEVVLLVVSSPASLPEQPNSDALDPDDATASA